MVAFSGRSRVPSGEARAPVKERGGPGPGRRGGLGVGLGAGAEGPRERESEATPEPGGTVPLGPTCAQVHLFLPGAPLGSGSRRNVLQMFAASLPAEGSAGSCASERKVSSWPQPISQMGEGKFSLRSFSFLYSA